MDPLGSIKEVFIVIVLILMNGLLAMLEMALGLGRVKAGWSSWLMREAAKLRIF